MLWPCNAHICVQNVLVMGAMCALQAQTCITWVQSVLWHHPLFEKMIDGAKGRRGKKKEHAIQKYCLREQLIKYTYNARATPSLAVCQH